MSQPQGRIDVGAQIMAARQMQCLNPDCEHEDSVAEFGRVITSREGMGVAYCTCPVCAASWRRIDVGRA